MESFLIIILIFSILIQLSAAIYALYLIKFTGFKYSWIFISIALFLMSLRRAIPFFSIITNVGYSFDLTNEIIGLILSILMLLGVRGIGSIFIERKNAEKKISLLLKEKELILKEVHHRIKNNMSTIYGLIVLQAESLTDPEGEKALDDTANRVLAMMALYEELFISGNYSGVSIKNYLPILVEKIISNFSNRSIVKTNITAEDCYIDPKKLSGIGLILNELLTNIMKYAFTGRDSGIINVILKNDSNKILLTIEDNGSGLPEEIDFKNSTGFGLTMVEMLTNQLDGTISFVKSNGTKIVLEFDAN